MHGWQDPLCGLVRKSESTMTDFADRIYQGKHGMGLLIWIS